MTVSAADASVWGEVVGQSQAVERLTQAAIDPVHAYMFVGPPGSTKDEASRAFAALLMAGTDDLTQRDARLALAGEHPDVREVLRQGARISKDQVGDIIRNASLAPVEGSRKVMILHEFHLLEAEGAARLLKTLEEPPASTIFIVLADQVTPELSRSHRGAYESRSPRSRTRWSRRRSSSPGSTRRRQRSPRRLPRATSPALGCWQPTRG
ncbi:MAG TPA: hypothetical protein VHQ23_16110 [Ilumatobacteraceae bacterium]|nr:hypothetical protein [Ilumatobacteraceae bacterium]